MAKLVQAKLKIEGTRPLFWHWFGPDAIPLERVERTGVAGNDPEEWRRTSLVLPDGTLYLPGNYAFATLRAGAFHTKRGKGSLMKPVSATMQVVNEIIKVDRKFPGWHEGADLRTIEPPPRDPTQSVYLDVRSAVNPSTKARNVRYRVVASPGWQVEFQIEWDPTIVSKPEMEAIAIDAGRLVGLANARTIGMGRFEVRSFEMVDAA